MQIASEFELGDKVIIDGDKSIVAVVSGFTWRGHLLIEVEWFHAGIIHSAWFHEPRLAKRNT
ncbi:hypothetical protein [Methylosinus sp. PW1]|uniref:hypothetical protein n=1 Tax=Methylosinus sp. PW1 TaxID=107636 RepID=UPI000567625F|nr:hypothetical protein [Methylosinus sp. PW1]